MQLPEDAVSMIQIDGPRRKVYIKFVTERQMNGVLSETNGDKEFKYDNGEISKVKVTIAGMGKCIIRIANLPPEVQESVIRKALGTYGDIIDITEEQWTIKYRYKVSNGIRLVNINLKQHVPSHLQISEHRVLISYEGQPVTCYGCNGTGHLYMHCPKRKQMTRQAETSSTKTWATFVAHANIPRNGDDRQQPDITVTEQGNDETGSTRVATTQKGEEAMNLEENMSEHRTEDEKDDEVRSKQDVHNINEETTHDVTQLEINFPTISTTSQIANDGGFTTNDQNKQRREDRTHIPDTTRAHEETGPQQPPTQENPNKNKKLRTERDRPTSREKTRSKTRAVLPNTQC